MGSTLFQTVLEVGGCKKCNNQNGTSKDLEHQRNRWQQQSVFQKIMWNGRLNMQFEKAASKVILNPSENHKKEPTSLEGFLDRIEIPGVFGWGGRAAGALWKTKEVNKARPLGGNLEPPHSKLQRNRYLAVYFGPVQWLFKAPPAPLHTNNPDLKP